MKIESRVPQTMYDPIPPTFGRIDALRGSSVEITAIIDYTIRHENRCVGAPGHGRTEYTHVWSLRRTGVDFRSILCRFCMKFYVRFEEMEASSQCFILPVNPSNHLIKKETPRQTSALQGACRRRLFQKLCSFFRFSPIF